MAHSFADRPTLNCPDCGQPFTPELWLIIDAAERPGLLARVRDGAIHHFTCPNGHAAAVDAPLLIYRPGQSPPLLFSPAERTTAEQDREMAAGLIGRLAESLGGEWHEAWLTDVAGVPRAALPAVLDGATPPAAAESLAGALPPGIQAALAEVAAALAADGVTVRSQEELDRALAARPELRRRLEAAVRAAQGDAGPEADMMTDPLTTTLRAYVETPDWVESYRFLLAHPELLTDAADERLAWLVDAATTAGRALTAEAFAEHRALLRRARAVGEARAYAEKLGMTPEQMEGLAAADLPPAAVRQALEEVVAALKAEGIAVDSPAALQAALAARPALRAKLEAAVQEATPAGPGEEPADDPDDPLPAALQTFVEAETWFASYQHVRDHPELLSDAAEERLAGLVEQATAAGNEPVARVFAEHLALLRRARAVGAAQAFAEKMGTTADELEAAAEGAAAAAAIPPQAQQVLQEIVAALEAEGVSIRSPEELQAALATRPELAARLAAALGGAAGDDRPDVPERYRADVGRAGAAGERYRRTGDPAALDEAAAAWARVLDDPGFPAAPERFQLAALNDAGGVFLRRYWAGGRLPDLDRALALWNDALARTPDDSPERAGTLSNLGLGLRNRSALTGRPEDLDAAVAAWQSAVAHTPTDSPDRAGYLNNLGIGLHDRYALTGQPEDLDAAIVAYEDAVARTPADSPNRAGRLNNLGNGLRDRYVRTGRPEDLDAAVAAWQSAVAHTPADSPDWATIQNNLGAGLRDRYVLTGQPEDLDAAVAAWQSAVARTPADSPDRAAIQNNLGAGLRDRYALTGRPEDLDAAIAANEDAVARTPADSPDRAIYLNSLGNGLRARYARVGRPQDLDAAIAAYEDAAARIPADSPERAGIQSNLGNGLSDRYARTGRAADLDAAIAAYEDAVRRTPADSPDQAGRLNNLGNGLRDRYARARRRQDLDAAIAAHQGAVARTPANSPDRAMYLNNLGNGLRDRYARTGQPVDLDAAVAAFEDAVARIPADSPDRASMQNNLGNGLSDRYARTGRPQDLDAAVAAYEDALARTLADSPDRAMYLNNLGGGLRDRYARTGQPEDLDAALDHCRVAARVAAATAGETALGSARDWASLALARQLWAETLQAAAQGRATLRRLDEANVLAGERLSWRRAVQGLAAAEAYALARRGDPAAAVLALETGQAGQINAALGRGRDRELLERLRGDAPDLFAAYETAAAEVRAAQRAGGESWRDAPGVRRDAPGVRRDAPGARPDAAALRDRAAAAQTALDDVVARIAARPGYEMLFAPPAFDDVAAAVGGAPLAYLATTPAGSVILLLHRAEGGVTAEALLAGLTTDELDRLLLRRAVAAGNVGALEGGLLVAQVGGIGLTEELAEALPLLGERLMAPLAARLRQLETTDVTLIPGGRLNLLPLHAATYQVDGTARAFLDEFAVAFAPSGQSRKQEGGGAGGQGSGGAGVLVVGNPQPVQPPLRYAREEAEAVAGLLAGDAAFAGGVTALYETAATLPAVVTALPGRRVLHFACHGTFDPAEPLDSGLVMSGGERLTLRAVRDGAALAGTRLVVLSACQTGLTDFRELPDEVIGLPAGFLVAGAAGVVGSLWPVDDRSTALLMSEFHRRVLAGAPPAEALRAAQIWLRGVTWGELDAYYSHFLPRMSAPSAEAAQVEATGHDPRAAAYADPYHWAAFTFSGA